MNNFGKEAIIDLHDCDASKFNRKDIKKYLINLCKLIDMKRENLHWWDYKGFPEEYEKAPNHLKGTSCVQFITTSNITVHTIDPHKRAYFNIFSCKDFNGNAAADFTADWFKGTIINFKEIDRV